MGDNGKIHLSNVCARTTVTLPGRESGDYLPRNEPMKKTSAKPAAKKSAAKAKPAAKKPAKKK